MGMARGAGIFRSAAPDTNVTQPAPQKPDTTKPGEAIPAKKDSKPESQPQTEPAPNITSPAASPTAKPTGPAGQLNSKITIASLNIEWLGKSADRSGAAKGIAQDPADLADVIITSKADLLALQEIVTQLPGSPKRSREVEAVLEAITKRTKERWDYVLFPGRQDGDQLTGIMWNTSKLSAVKADGSAWVQPTDTPWSLPIPKGRSAQGSAHWNRPPHAMKFTTGKDLSDFVVIVVHMKADYQGDFAAHRAEEAQGLAKVLPKVRETFKDEDIVIIGDTNCVQAVEPAADALVAAGFRDLNSGKLQTHWRGGTMDRAFVPTTQPEFTKSTLTVISDAYLRSKRWRPEDYKRNISDHYPITFELTIAKDDD
jgi:endonuclease/exonuclease/phosphatase family metal-dependent hydrolase